MEFTLLMLFTLTLTVVALIGSVTPHATPPQGELSDLDMYILDDAGGAQPLRIEDPAVH